MLLSFLSFYTFMFAKKKKNSFSYWTGNCKDKYVSVRSMFFNRAVFLMESTLNIIILTKRDDLLLILNILFSECL